jgi:hypothetical protein
VSRWVRDLAEKLLDLAAASPVEAVLERRGDIIVERPQPSLH